MYRIKTDIRQYKCETKDKVEKLIRNWVIRPNDLIYHSHQKTWDPIGDHPEFVSLFGLLEAQESAEPDTVVTSDPRASRTTDAVDTNELDAAERDVEPAESSDDGEAEKSEPETLSDDESDEAAADPDGRADADADEVRETVALDQEDVHPEESDAPDNEDAPDEEDDELEPADEGEKEPLAVPEAPVGVTPNVRSDEVTMMTEKTLDMLTITDEHDAIERDDESDADAGEDEDQPEAEDEADKTPAESETKADDEEVTDVRNRKEISPDEDELEENELEVGLQETSGADDVAAASVKEKGLSVSGPRLGRHNLPEEFFATNDISGPFDRDAVMDELGELSEGDTGDEESGVDEAWGEMVDDFRVTAELPAATVEELADESTAVVDEDEVIAADEAYQDEDSYDEDEWDEYEDELDASEVAAQLFGPPTDHVADPYAIPLPFEIRPTDNDVSLGIRRSSSSRTQKDREFPYPLAKEKDRVYLRTFDLTPPPPSDRSAYVIAAFVVAVVMLMIVLVMVF